MHGGNVFDLVVLQVEVRELVECVEVLECPDVVVVEVQHF